MIYQKEFPVRTEVMGVLLERAKLLKCTYACFTMVGDGSITDVTGMFGDNPCAVKTIDNLMPVEVAIPFNFAIRVNDMASMIKECIQEGIQNVTIIGCIDPIHNHWYGRHVVSGIKIVKLQNYDLFASIATSVLGGCSVCEAESGNLSEDVSFADMLTKKSSFGTQFVNICGYPITLMPSILNVNKGDTVEAKIYPIPGLDDEKLICLSTVKTKKKFVLNTYMKFRVLR